MIHLRGPSVSIQNLLYSDRFAVAVQFGVDRVVRTLAASG
jgi:hypothetical protein